MRITLDASSPVPAFEQIKQSVAALAASGALPVGTRLPTVRQFAKDLGVAPGTVARSYRELEEAGVIETEGRKGSRIASAAIDTDPSTVNSAVNDLVRNARRSGIELDDLLSLVRRSFHSAQWNG